MFDLLTLNDLYDLHHQLNEEGERLHQKFMALPSVISDEGNLFMAKTAEISEAMDAVYAEIDRRLKAQGSISALRELRRGTDA